MFTDMTKHNEKLIIFNSLNCALCSTDENKSSPYSSTNRPKHRSTSYVFCRETKIYTENICTALAAAQIAMLQLAD